MLITEDSGVFVLTTHRQRVQQDGDEEDNYSEDDKGDEEASKPSPYNEFHGLAGVGEPEERRFWATGGKRKTFLLEVHL